MIIITAESSIDKNMILLLKQSNTIWYNRAITFNDFIDDAHYKYLISVLQWFTY